MMLPPMKQGLDDCSNDQFNSVFTISSVEVEVNFKGQLYNTVTGKDGKWSIKLAAQTGGGPYNITFKGKANTVELKNILFGDVCIFIVLGFSSYKGILSC